MADRGLDPAGPVLAVLFGVKSSDVVVDVTAKHFEIIPF